MTNIDSHRLAVRLATHFNEPELRKVVVKALSRTERNFVLKNGETTKEIEHAKLEHASVPQTLGAVGDLVNKVRKG